MWLLTACPLKRGQTQTVGMPMGTPSDLSVQDR